MEKRIIPVVRQFNIKRIQSPIPRIKNKEVINDVIKRSQVIKNKIGTQIIQRPVKVVQNNVRIAKYVKQSIRVPNPIIKDYNYNKLMSIKNSGKGNILVMIACGPSVNEIDLSPLKNINNLKTMIINKPVDSVWPSNYWAFCDHSQYVRNQRAFEEYTGLLLNSIGVKARRSNQILISARQGKGFNKDITQGYFIGRSSVYANMQTALFMDFDKIFIFGIDMCAVNGKTHHYGDGSNPDVETKIRIQRFNYEADHYMNASSIMSSEDRNKFYFCSSYNKFPFIEKFNKLDHKIAVNYILELPEIKSSCKSIM
jgi:hypothetical protein